MSKNNKNDQKKQSKSAWFETVSGTDEPTTGRKSGDDTIPPFNSQESEPIRGDIFGDLPEDGEESRAGGKRSGSRTTGTGTKKSGTSSASTRGGSRSGKESGRGRGQTKPADLAYRIQPYLVLFFGAFLAIMLFWSFAASSGAYLWTSQTHPFGFVGYYVETILFGILGYGTYLLPAAMVYLSILPIKEGSQYRSRGKKAIAAGLIWLIPAIIHTCMIGGDPLFKTYNLKTLYNIGASHGGGGVFPGLLGTLGWYAIRPLGMVLLGGALALFLLMWLLDLTPAMIWQWLRARRAARLEREEEARAAAEQERLAMEKDKKTAARRRLSPATEAEEDELLLPPPDKTAKRAKRDELQLVRRSDSRAEEAPAQTEAQGNYIDPTGALLAGAKSRRGKKEEQNEGGYTPETVFPDEGEVTPLEYVSEVRSATDREMEAALGSQDSVASEIPLAYEPEEPGEAEGLRAYPGRAELDLDEELDSEELTGELLGAEETADYQGGFDYSMESSDEEDDLDDETEDGVDMMGGVAVKVERLSEEERMRGATVAAPAEEDEPAPRPYTYPRVDLLDPPKPHNAQKEQEIRAKKQKLEATLTNFKVGIESTSYVCGPSVTRYEVKPAPGVRVRSIANLADDIAMSLAAKSIRIEAPIPGKEAVGIEVPNTTRETVYLRRLIDSEDFRSRSSKLTACLGEDVAGTPILFDIVKMPHLLVAGTTGSGKSVCINDFLMSLVFKASPQEVKIILIDPKQVEFTVYKDLPHLMAPIVCDPKRAAAALNLAVLEMERRFQLIKEVGVRKISDYNTITENDRFEHPYMPNIVIVIDELADLMMQAKDEVETSIVRLAQKGRAAGIHLIIGTQRPSVDVITGLIKANIPSRIACTVVSQVDSRTILDVAGAEKLLGMGDMLYAPIGSPKPLRVQGAFVSDGEVERIVEFIKKNNDLVRYDQEFLDNLDREAQMIGTKRQAMEEDDFGEEGADGMDPKFYEALRIAIDSKRISTSLLQRTLSIGYGRAAKIIDQMERMGFVGPAVGNKPREIRISEQGYAELIMNKE